MRTLLTVSMEVGASNKAIMDGSLPKVMKAIMEKLKPEAAYFFALHGKRTGIMVFDMKDPSEIPVICEPFFMGMNADVHLTPVMDVVDLQKGLDAWQKTL